MKTLTSSVGFQGPDGTLLKLGSLVLTLPDGMYEIISGGGQVSGGSVILNFDVNAKLVGSPQIWCTDELTGNPLYVVQLCSGANGLGPVANARWNISGSSPIDLSLMVTTSSGISFPLAVLQNPAAQQNINGQTLNMEGASLSFSAAASTTADSFFSRLSAGVIAVGTAIGNALGTLQAAIVQIGGPDTGLSRTAAETVALGNGAQGDSSGTFQAAKFIGNSTGTGGGASVQAVSSSPSIALENTGGGADSKWWDFTLTSTQLLGRTLNDAINNAIAWVTVSRSGNNISGIAFGAGGGTQTMPTSTGTLAIGNPKFQQFTSSGTFTIPVGVTGVEVTVVGGGGGGAGTNGTNSGAGGGSAAVATKFLSGLTPGLTIVVTVGGAGAGGTAGANNGSGGGTSSIASGTQAIGTVTATGGGGGSYNSFGGTAGSASGGDLNFGGTPGNISSGSANAGTQGSVSLFDGGGVAGFTGVGGTATAPGAGGGGAGGGAGNQAGGSGAAGVVIFKWVQ